MRKWRPRVLLGVVLLLLVHSQVSFLDRDPGPHVPAARVDVRVVVRAARAMTGTLYDPLGGRLWDLGGTIGFLTCADVPVLAYAKAGVSLRHLLIAEHARAPEAFGRGHGDDPTSPYFERRAKNLHAWARSAGQWLPRDARPAPGDLAFYARGEDDPVGHVALVTKVDRRGRAWVVEAARRAVLVHEVPASDVVDRGWKSRGFGRVRAGT